MGNFVIVNFYILYIYIYKYITKNSKDLWEDVRVYRFKTFQDKVTKNVSFLENAIRYKFPDIRKLQMLQ